MRAGLDPWPFVIASYALAIIATFALVWWSWRAMRRAEQRREEVRCK